jgi:hypothetical protein
MSAPQRSAHPLPPAGPLTEDAFAAAILRGTAALDRGQLVPGVHDPVSIPQLWLGALSAVDAYCDGDRAAAEEAVTEALLPGWAMWPAEARERALGQGRALLVWVEGHDPSRN